MNKSDEIVKYKLIHNGMNIEYFRTTVDVRNYINDVLKQNMELEPRMVYERRMAKGAVKLPYGYDAGIDEVLIYQYRTGFMECFVTTEQNIKCN